MSESTTSDSSSKELTAQLARGGGTAFAGQMVGRGFSLLLQIVLTRVLGPVGYGLYALGHNILGVAETVSMAGLGQGVVRFGPVDLAELDRSRLKGTLLSSLGASFAIGIAVAFVLYLLSDVLALRVFTEPKLAPVLRGFAWALPFYTLVTMCAHCARAFRRIDIEVAISRLVHPVLVLVAVAISFLLGWRLLGAVYGFVISSVLSGAVGILLVARLFPDLFTKLPPRFELSRLLSYSLTVTLSGLSLMVISRTDRIMLGIMRTAGDVGIYNAAAAVGVQASLFLISLNAIFAPTVADLHHRGLTDQLARALKIVSRWILYLTLPVVVVLCLFSRQVMAVFGREFAAGGSALISLALAHLVNAAVGPVGYVLMMSGHHRLSLLNNASLGGINIALNYLLIPAYGPLGAGLATAISLAAINVLRLLEVYYLFRIHPYDASHWKPLAAAALGCGVWLLVGRFVTPRGLWWLVPAIGVGIVYLGALLAFGLKKDDKALLLAVRSRLMRNRSDRRV